MLDYNYIKNVAPYVVDLLVLCDVMITVLSALYTLS